jgi:excisionase family DNA binding protein
MEDDSGLYLTPEQVAQKLQLTIETVYRWLRCGKLRGTRMSQKAWRIADRDLRSFMTKQNVSELLFEDYLAERSLGIPDHEPTVRGKSKRIDYRLLWKNQLLWFEVKEFAEDARCAAPGMGGAYDPYVGIRTKIDKAAEKFREYKEECCSLVLYNDSLNLVDICTPSIVLGAMLGDVGFRIPIDFEKGIEAGPHTTFFGQGGKLVHPHTKAPRNTRISAVIALERFPVGQKTFRVAVARKEAAEDRRLAVEEFLGFLSGYGNAYNRTALRALVYENPDAAKRLPRDLFQGPFDIQWGTDATRSYMTRLFVGPDMTKLESEEHELGLDLNPFQRRRAALRQLPAGAGGPRDRQHDTRMLGEIGSPATNEPGGNSQKPKRRITLEDRKT